MEQRGGEGEEEGAEGREEEEKGGLPSSLADRNHLLKLFVLLSNRLFDNFSDSLLNFFLPERLFHYFFSGSMLDYLMVIFWGGSFVILKVFQLVYLRVFSLVYLIVWWSV